MAIIKELGIQAAVYIGKHPAPEYIDTEPSISEQFGPNTKKSHSYVQCSGNSHFSIKFKVTSPSNSIQKWLADDLHAILYDVAIDGKELEDFHWVFRRSPSHQMHGVTDFVNGLLHKFRFSSVSTVDDSSKSRVARDTELTKHLGEIRVRAWRVINTKARRPIRQAHRPSLLEGQVAEKALKGRAIAHGTTFSPAVAVARRKNSAVFERKDALDSPLAVFYFKYRSKEDLQKEMIIPRPRSPSPPLEDGQDKDFANLSREEIERLARERHAELRGRKRSATVKLENVDDVPRAGRPYKFTRIEGGKKAIDLTEDDDDDDETV